MRFVYIPCRHDRNFKTDTSHSAGITPGVTLLAVSKHHTPENILQAYNAGLRDFGENYVQELHAKQAQLPKAIQWHFIGHLQRNKVKQILPYVYLIHSLDRKELAHEIEKQAALIGKIQPVLLQLHVASETSKFGFSEDEFQAFIHSDITTRYPHLKILGLMAMASFTNETAILEQEFKKAKRHICSYLLCFHTPMC